MTNNAEREAFEKVHGLSLQEIEKLPVSSGTRMSLLNAYDREWTIWRAARAQASGVPDDCQLGCSTYCKAKAHGCASECPKLNATPTPPKSASVPVERLNALVEEWRTTSGAYYNETSNTYDECADKLAELIAEHKI